MITEVDLDLKQSSSETLFESVITLSQNGKIHNYYDVDTSVARMSINEP